MTYRHRKSKRAVAGVTELHKRLRAVEADNAKLKQLVAEQLRVIGSLKRGPGRSEAAFQRAECSIAISADPLVSRVQRWLSRHFREDVRIAEVAQRFGVSTRKLRRLFQATTGDTLIAHLQKLRVEHARKLLAKTRLPVAQVVRRSGYVDVGVFAELFKRYTKLTPTEYRKGRLR